MNIENIKPWQPATEIDLNLESVSLFVNREYNLPKDYVPKDLVMPNIRFAHPGLGDRRFYEQLQQRLLKISLMMQKRKDIYYMVYLDTVPIKLKRHLSKQYC